MFTKLKSFLYFLVLVQKILARLEGRFFMLTLFTYSMDVVLGFES